MQNQKNKLFNTGSDYKTVKVETPIYMYDRYFIREVIGEGNITEYQIVDSTDLLVEETYDDKSEAEDCLKFWNQ